MRAEARRRQGGGWALALPTAAVAVGVAFLLLLPRAHVALTTYASVSTPAATADLLAGLAMFVGATVAGIGRPASAIGTVALLAGIAWFAADAVGWAAGPSGVRTLAMIVAPFLLPLVAHVTVLILRAPASANLRRAIAWGYGATAVASLGWALFRDPFLDRACWSNCLVNDVLLVHSEPAAAALDVLWSVLVVVVGSGLVVFAGWRLSPKVRAASPSDLAGWLGLIGGAVFGVASIAWVAALVVYGAEDPAQPAFIGSFLLRAAAVIGLGVALVASVLAERRRRRAILRLARESSQAPEPGTLQRVLATALGDPTMTVAYRLADQGTWVDADGEAVAEPSVRDGRMTTSIVRGGAIVATISHDHAVSSDEVAGRLGAAARLAVDNERLAASVRAELRQLRLSRERIVDAGDLERRRLERNLHDGAQQQLLALSFDVRRAHAAAVDRGADGQATLLADASSETQRAIDDLRDVAHGIFPVVLTEAGLRPALESLAEASPIPVEIVDMPAGRCAEPVELAAYHVALGALQDPAGSPATGVRMAARRDGGTLVLTIDREGGTSTPADEVVDRVGAAGGRLTVTDTGAGTSMRVELPCA